VAALPQRAGVGQHDQRAGVGQHDQRHSSIVAALLCIYVCGVNSLSRLRHQSNSTGSVNGQCVHLGLNSGATVNRSSVLHGLTVPPQPTFDASPGAHSWVCVWVLHSGTILLNCPVHAQLSRSLARSTQLWGTAMHATAAYVQTGQQQGRPRRHDFQPLAQGVVYPA
jgi:hypothetical protein